MKKFLLLLAIVSLSWAVEVKNLEFVGKISCKNGENLKGEFEILKLEGTGRHTATAQNLGQYWAEIQKSYWITQTSNGSCSLDDDLSLEVVKPVDALVLIKSFIDAFDLKYVVDGNAQYKPALVAINQDGLNFKELLDFLVAEYVKPQNEDLVVRFVPERRLILLLRKETAPEGWTDEGKCDETLTNFVDLRTPEGTYERFVVNFSTTGVQLVPYRACANATAAETVSCPDGAPLGNAYLDNVDLVSLLKLFEKVFGIRFVYNPDELAKLKHADRLHLVLSCLDRDEAVEFLKNNFHLHLEKVAENTYRIFPSKDDYYLALKEVSDYETRVFFVQNLSLRKFVKLLELYYGDKVTYSVDPTFGAVTVIGPAPIIAEIEKRFGVYIRDAEQLDRLISKIFYVKFGDPAELAEQIKEYLSEKGKVTVLSDVKALEVMDYPTNIAIVEKVFGKFLSQRPIKIKVVAKFVRINRSFARTLGINWEFGYGNPGTAESINLTVQNNVGGNIGLTANAVFLYKKFNPINLSISAGETLGLSKVLSSPSLVLLSDQSGNISFGTQIPYQSVDENGNPKTELVSATLTLNVTPKLLPDGRILLNLQLSNNAPNTALAVNGQPAIDTFTIQQNFVVSDGDSIVIGGVLKKTNEKSESGTPVFRKIPLLGWLFKTKNWTNEDTELFVIITAKVVSE
ncbi:MAG: hypothetical protein GXO08_03875 [Aquificae bacterium]|nr:hypothetical protein [Aquificota bacterium]